MIFSDKPLVFVSYSRKDKEKVDDLSRRLTKRGVKLWVDRRDIGGGEWRQSIKKALRQSRIFLACLSKNTLERGEVLQYEFDSALEIQADRLETDIYLLPVRLEPCEVPESLAHLQYFDAFEEDDFNHLVKVIHSKSELIPARAAAWGLLVVVILLAGYLWLRPSAKGEFLEARSQGKSAPVSGPVRLGLTLWKMEKSQDSDPPSTREIVHPQSGSSASVELTPVRLSIDKQFRLGDRFEAGIETSRAGFLYVLNRTLRSDGSAGPATLIFPTNRIREGDNWIWPGRLIRLPDLHSDPPYWEFRSARPDYAGELLIALLVSEPIEDLTPQDNAVAVDDAAVAGWIKRYGGDVQTTRYESKPLRLTVAEAAARDRGAQLPRSAPLPQVVIEADRPSNGGIAATFPIKVTRD